jgi:Zn-dependent M28 family amino/carboxypeptidase
MAGGEITATVSVVIEAHDSRNVIAELPGTADDGRVVVLGGHYDTVADTQGADDNGSGIATLITLAREVSQTQFPFTVRFIAFGSEEVGLFGSKHYVGSLSSDERQSIIAMLNFDVPGSGSVLEAIGSADLVDQAMQYADEHGLAVERGTSLELEGATSDHAPFSEVGIPVLFFPADDLSRINSPDDTIEFVNPELLGTAAALGLALLDSLAGR